MVTKRKTAKKQVKVGKLKLNKETLKDLSSKDAKKVKGGAAIGKWKTQDCPSDDCRA